MQGRVCMSPMAVFINDLSSNGRGRALCSVAESHKTQFAKTSLVMWHRFRRRVQRHSLADAKGASRQTICCTRVQ